MRLSDRDKHRSSSAVYERDGCIQVGRRRRRGAYLVSPGHALDQRLLPRWVEHPELLRGSKGRFGLAVCAAGDLVGKEERVRARAGV